MKKKLEKSFLKDLNFMLKAELKRSGRAKNYFEKRRTEARIEVITDIIQAFKSNCIAYEIKKDKNEKTKTKKRS